MDTPAVAGTSDDSAPRAPHTRIYDAERPKPEPSKYGNMTSGDSRRDTINKKGRRPHPTPARTRRPAIFLAMSGFHPDDSVDLRGAGRLGLLMG